MHYTQLLIPILMIGTIIGWLGLIIAGRDYRELQDLKETCGSPAVFLSATLFVCFFIWPILVSGLLYEIIIDPLKCCREVIIAAKDLTDERDV